jgi:plastocyanin
MKQILFFALLTFSICISIFSCTKHEAYMQAGGNLPTQYMTVLPDGKMQPATVTIASGGSITFVNSHNKPHQILTIDADSSIYTPVIAPGSSFIFKNDTLLGSFSYKCILDSSINGNITIRP